MTYNSESYNFNLIRDAVGEDDPDLIDERLDQIRERVRIGTLREAMADRDFLMAYVDQRPVVDMYARGRDA